MSNKINLSRLNRIAIVEYSLIYAYGFKQALNSIEMTRKSKVDIFNSSYYFLNSKINKYDLVLLDISILFYENKFISDLLVKANPNCKILVLSCNGDSREIMKCQAYRVNGLLMKGCNKIDLEFALKKLAMMNYSYDNSQLFDRTLLNSRKGLEVPFFEELNPIENKLLQLISQGLTENEIIFHMDIPEKIVLFHRSRLLRRFDVSNSEELLNKVIDLGIFSKIRRSAK